MCSFLCLSSCLQREWLFYASVHSTVKETKRLRDTKAVCISYRDSTRNSSDLCKFWKFITAFFEGKSLSYITTSIFSFLGFSAHTIYLKARFEMLDLRGLHTWSLRQVVEMFWLTLTKEYFSWSPFDNNVTTVRNDLILSAETPKFVFLFVVLVMAAVFLLQ